MYTYMSLVGKALLGGIFITLQISFNAWQCAARGTDMISQHIDCARVVTLWQHIFVFKVHMYRFGVCFIFEGVRLLGN